MQYDVVVMGSGGAGLTAALVAAKAGCKVCVLEKAPHFGGTTAISGGCFEANPGKARRQRASFDATEASFAESSHAGPVNTCSPSIR